MWSFAEREAQPGESRRVERTENVALVLGAIDRGPQERTCGDAGVVARREGVRAEASGELEHGIQADTPIAADARVGGKPGRLIRQPGVHDAGAELRAQVDREVRHPEPVGDVAGPPDGLGRAAAEVPVVVGVRPQLERHPDRLAAFRTDEEGSHGAVDPAAHRHERASCPRRDESAIAGGGAEGPVEGIRGELRGVALCGAQPAELCGEILRAEPRGVKQGNAPDAGHGGAPGGEHGAAAARVEAGVGDDAVGAVGVEGDREAYEVPARRSAGGACE